MPPKTHNTDVYNTPVGPVTKPLINQVMTLAGIKWDEKYQDWTLLAYECKSKRINPNANRKANEDHIILQKMFLPLRFYNFMYALSECDFNLEKAMQYVKDKLEGFAGEPVYLPEKLEIKTGEPISYTQIMNLISDKHQ